MTERRKFLRTQQLFQVQYQPRGTIGPAWRDGGMLNLSAGGMRLRSDGELSQGSRLTLRIRLPNMIQQLDLCGSVVWRRTVAAGVNEYGVAFADVSPLQHQQIDELVRFLLQHE